MTRQDLKKKSWLYMKYIGKYFGVERFLSNTV